jgi:uroporphyrinogen-III decarboxylase
LTGIERFDPVSRAWHPREFPVKNAQDIEAMSLIYKDERYEFDTEQFAKAQASIQEVGENGIVVTSVGISPLMNWIQHIAGVENGHLLMMDHPNRVDTLLENLHMALRRRVELVADRSPYSVIYSIENTSTTLISPDLFRQYCHRHLMEYGEIIHCAGKLHVLHMCGKLKLLLPDIATLPAAGIEAFTSPPVGNTTLLDGRTDCPDKCLIGGTNATLWLEPANTIIETIERHLDALPHHRGIVITSAGVMPPLCKPETIKQVAAWVKSYTVA